MSGLMAHRGLLLGSGAAPLSPLAASMVSYWEFEDNNSGSTFSDALGNYPMSVRNTAGAVTTNSRSYGPGLGNRGVYYGPVITDGETAYIPNASSFKFPNSDFTFGFFGMPIGTGETGGSTKFLLGNIGATVAGAQAWIYIDSADGFLKARFADSSSALTAVSSGVPTVIAEDYFMTVTLDRTNNQVIFRHKRVGGSTVKATASFTAALYTGSTSCNFCFSGGLSSDNTYFSGSRAGLRFVYNGFYCTRAITDAEFDYLVNSDNGKTWAQVYSNT